MSPFQAFLPLWITLAGALLLLALEVLGREAGRRASPLVAAAVLLAALVADFHTMALPCAPGLLFSGALVVDKLTLWSSAAILFAALFAVGSAAPYLKREKAVTGEYYALLLFAASGALILTAAEELMTLFIGLELLSLPAYVLAGYLRFKKESSEAALKYFLPGAFASALLLYGSALLYGASGSTFFTGIRAAITAGSAPILYVTAGSALVLGALAFKVAAAPFHAWAPDVYEGSPGPSVVFLATAVKAAAFTALLRLFLDALGPQPVWGEALGILAVLTLAIGNLGALVQTRVKRMLAYSSVAHAGYVLVGLSVVGVAPDADVARGVAFYLTAYTFMTAGAFAFLSWASGPGEKLENFSDFDGYAAKRPGEDLAFSVFLFSLAGMPPTGGFFGKYMLFKLAVDHGRADLAFVAIFFSLVSFAYYLKPIIAMYMKPGTQEPVPVSRAHQAVLLLALLGVLVLGFMPMPF